MEWIDPVATDTAVLHRRHRQPSTDVNKLVSGPPTRCALRTLSRVGACSEANGEVEGTGGTCGSDAGRIIRVVGGTEAPGPMPARS